MRWQSASLLPVIYGLRILLTYGCVQLIKCGKLFFGLYLLIGSVVDSVNWTQAWELLSRMGSNYECVLTLVKALLKQCNKGVAEMTTVDAMATSDGAHSISSGSAASPSLSATAAKEMFDSNLGNLFHKIILVYIHTY